MIDKVYQVVDPSDAASVSKTFDSIYEQATGLIHTDTTPTSGAVPFGKLVIYDNGTTRRVYVRTGKEGVGYFTLTML